MEFNKFIDTKEIEIDGKQFAVSRIPAMACVPIFSEIIKAYSDNGPLGLTMLPRDVVKTFLSYSAVKVGQDWLVLDTEMFINQTFTDFKTLESLILFIVKENFSFLSDGSLAKLLSAMTLEGGAESV